MITLVKILRSKYWDLFPLLIFIIVASLEGPGFWICGTATIVWVFTFLARYIMKLGTLEKINNKCA